MDAFPLIIWGDYVDIEIQRSFPIDMLKVPKHRQGFKVELLESIKRDGLRHPISLDIDFKVVNGYQRIAVAKALGCRYIDAVWERRFRVVQDNVAVWTSNDGELCRVVSNLHGTTKDELVCSDFMLPTQVNAYLDRMKV